MFKPTGNKQSTITDPLKDLYESAGSIRTKFTKQRKPHDLELIADVLAELLCCQVRFLTSVYVCLFLQKDYTDQEMDGRVLNFLNGIYTTVNELVGLCEDLSPFLSREGLDKKYAADLFRVQFDNLRLKAPPIADPEDPLSIDFYMNYGEHVWQTIERFRKGTDFLNKSGLEIDWNHLCYDSFDVFRTASSRLIRKNSFSRDAVRGFYQKSGSCRLCLPEGESILLDPIIIPLKNHSRSQRLAALVRFGGYQFQGRGSILYHQLTGDGAQFCTDDRALFKKLYEKKGFVSEAPVFAHDTMLLDGKIRVQLYQGDIFDLNFMENAPRTAMVNILYADLVNKTQLSKRLESLAGSDIFDDLKSQEPLSKERVYVTGPGELPGERRFKMIFHCPVYDIKEGKNPRLNTIKTAIQNLLDECVTQGITCLVAPAMGSFWAGQTRHEVASTWIDTIQNHSTLKDSSLKRIIFSFINPETCDVYQKCLRAKTYERFSAYHLPVSRLHNDIVTCQDSRERLDKVLDLCEYLYNFMVAWCIRSMMWERIRSEASGRPNQLNDHEAKFLNEFYKRAGFSGFEAAAAHEDGKDTGRDEAKRSISLIQHIKESAVVEKAKQLKIRGSLRREKLTWSKRLTPGDWRALAKLGYEAIRDHEWSFNRWFSDSDKFGRKMFHQFLNSGGEITDFASLRNKMAHPRWHTRSSAEVQAPAGAAVADIRKVIEHLPFLQQDKNRLALIEEFKVNEDAGRCRITFRDLGGEWSTPPQKTLSLAIKDLSGRLFETGRVYMIENLPDESIKALNMHPFLLYGECPGCHRDRLFVWRDLNWKVGRQVKISYGSTTCKCDHAIDQGDIARNSHQKLNERLENIMRKLGSKSSETVPSSPADQQML